MYKKCKHKKIHIEMTPVKRIPKSKMIKLGDTKAEKDSVSLWKKNKVVKREFQ